MGKKIITVVLERMDKKRDVPVGQRWRYTVYKEGRVVAQGFAATKYGAKLWAKIDVSEL